MNIFGTSYISLSMARKANNAPLLLLKGFCVWHLAIIIQQVCANVIISGESLIKYLHQYIYISLCQAQRDSPNTFPMSKEMFYVFRFFTKASYIIIYICILLANSYTRPIDNFILKRLQYSLTMTYTCHFIYSLRYLFTYIFKFFINYCPFLFCICEMFIRIYGMPIKFIACDFRYTPRVTIGNTLYNIMLLFVKFYVDIFLVLFSFSGAF